jgi:hypothetical protein
VVPLQTYSKRFTRRQLRSFKLGVAGNVLFVGLRSGRLTSFVDAFECMVTSPFAREKNIGFYTLSQFFLRFVGTDTEKLQLLVWLQDKAAGFVMFDQPALEALLNECTRQFAVEHAQLTVAFQSVRLHRPMERVLLALDQVMPRLTIEA